MLTNYILGLLSSLHFVGCGAQIRFGPLWISNCWLSFSLCWNCVKFPIIAVDAICCGLRLCFLVCARSWASPLLGDCGWLPSFIEGLWLLMHPGFGLLLSCFGHARAKNNPELSYGSELCFTCWLELSPGCLCLLHRAMNGLFCCGTQWLVFRLL